MTAKRCPVIGLTGGIGAGKSLVAETFRRLGAVVIDADRLARDLLDTPDVRDKVVGEFGEGVAPEGRISRKALADRVFTDGRLLEKLNAIVHPAVIGETKRIIACARADGSSRAVVLDAPLIIEAGLEGLCDVMVFVDASPEARARRLAADRGWERGEIERREKFQKSLIYKREQADYTVDDNGSPDEAVRQAADIWGKVVGS